MLALASVGCQLAAETPCKIALYGGANGAAKHCEWRQMGVYRRLLPCGPDRWIRARIRHNCYGTGRQDCGGWRRVRTGGADVEEHRERVAQGRSRHERCG